MNDTLEIVDLEQLTNGECKCESKHNYSECSYEVVARKITCTNRFLICENSRVANEEWFLQNHLCPVCYLLARECWRIIPV